MQSKSGMFSPRRRSVAPYGLEPGMLHAVGGDAKPVDVCPMYPKCVTYLDSFGDKMCSCGDESYQPFADSTDIKPADACPPE